MLFSWGILNASEEPGKKVPDLDPTIKKVIGFLNVSNNTTKFVDNKFNDSDMLVQAVKWGTTEYPRKFELVLWDHGYRTFKFQRTSNSNKN